MSTKGNGNKGIPGLGEKRDKPNSIPKSALAEMLNRQIHSLNVSIEAVSREATKTRSKGFGDIPVAAETLRARIQKVIDSSPSEITEQQQLDKVCEVVIKAVSEFKGKCSTDYMKDMSSKAIKLKAIKLYGDARNHFQSNYELPSQAASAAIPTPKMAQTAPAVNLERETDIAPTPPEVFNAVLSELKIPSKELPDKVAQWIHGIATLVAKDHFKSLGMDDALRFSQKVSRGQVIEMTRMFSVLWRMVEDRLRNQAKKAPLDYPTIKTVALQSLNSFKWHPEKIPSRVSELFNGWVIELVKDHFEKDQFIRSADEAKEFEDAGKKLNEKLALESMLPDKWYAASLESNERQNLFPLSDEEKDFIQSRRNRDSTDNIETFQEIAELLNKTFHGGIPLRDEKIIKEAIEQANTLNEKNTIEEAEAMARAEEQRRADEARLKAEEESARRAEQERALAEEQKRADEARLKAEEESARRAEQERALADEQKRADEARLKAEAEKRAVEEERKKAEEKNIILEQARQLTEGTQRTLEDEKVRIEEAKGEIQIERERIQREKHALETEQLALNAERDSLLAQKNYLETENASLDSQREQIEADRIQLESEISRFKEKQASATVSAAIYPIQSESQSPDAIMANLERMTERMRQQLNGMTFHQELLKVRSGLLQEVEKHHALRHPPIASIQETTLAAETALTTVTENRDEAMFLLSSLFNCRSYARGALVNIKRENFGSAVAEINESLKTFSEVLDIYDNFNAVESILTEVQTTLSQIKDKCDEWKKQINTCDAYFSQTLPQKIFGADPLALLGEENRRLLENDKGPKTALDALDSILMECDAALKDIDNKKNEAILPGLEENCRLAAEKIKNMIPNPTIPEVAQEKVTAAPEKTPQQNEEETATFANNPQQNEEDIAHAPAEAQSNPEAPTPLSISQLNILKILTADDAISHSGMSMHEIFQCLIQVFDYPKDLGHTMSIAISKEIDQIKYKVRTPLSDGPTAEMRNHTSKLLICWQNSKNKNVFAPTSQGIAVVQQLPAEKQLSIKERKLVSKMKTGAK